MPNINAGLKALQSETRFQNTTNNTVDESSRDQLKRACRDFESIFINYMLSEMRKTVPTNPLFDGGQAEKLYFSMLDSEVAKTISQQRGIGLAPMMYQQMSALVDHDTTKK